MTPPLGTFPKIHPICKRDPSLTTFFKLLPDIVDSSVNDASEAVDLCVAQIKNGLAKADDIPDDGSTSEKRNNLIPR